MATKKRTTKAARDRARQEVAALYLQGVTQVDIAERLGVTQQQVSYDLLKLREAWLASSLRDFDTARSQELAKVDNLELTYWSAWERSCQDAETTTQKAVQDKVQRQGDERPALLPVRNEITKVAKGQAGDPRFLTGVMACIERRCKILGIDAPEKKDITSKGEAIKAYIGVSPDDWDDAGDNK